MSDEQPAEPARKKGRPRGSKRRYAEDLAQLQESVRNALRLLDRDQPSKELVTVAVEILKEAVQ